jgi:hypothetical protein
MCLAQGTWTWGLPEGNYFVGNVAEGEGQISDSVSFDAFDGQVYVYSAYVSVNVDIGVASDGPHGQTAADTGTGPAGVAFPLAGSADAMEPLQEGDVGDYEAEVDFADIANVVVAGNQIVNYNLSDSDFSDFSVTDPNQGGGGAAEPALAALAAPCQ